MKKENSRIWASLLILFITFSIFLFREKINSFYLKKLFAFSFSPKRVEKVEKGGFGVFASFSKEKNLSLSFIDNKKNVIFAQKIKGKWIKEKVAENGLFGTKTFLAFSKKGTPFILYIDQNFSLNLAQKKGNFWEIEKIHQNVALTPNLSFDEKDKPFLSFWDFKKGALFLAKKEKGKWKKELLDKGKVGWWNSLALRKKFIYLSYFDFKNKDLLFLFFDSKKWQKETVDFKGDVGRKNSLILDKKGNVYIVYLDESLGKIKMALKKEGGWQIEEIDSCFGNFVLRKTEKEEPIVFYYDPKSKFLKLALFREGKWQKIKFIFLGKILKKESWT